MLSNLWTAFRRWLDPFYFPQEPPPLEHVCGLFKDYDPFEYVGSGPAYTGPLDNWGG